MTAAKVLMVTAALTIAAAVAGVSQSRTAAPPAAAVNRGITLVPGIRVGQFTLAERPTGCTVVLVEGDGAVGGVSQRGGAPGTRETDLLDPLNMVDTRQRDRPVGRQRLRPRRRAGRRQVSRRAADRLERGRRRRRADRAGGHPVRPRLRRRPEDPSRLPTAATRRRPRRRTAPWPKATSAPARARPSARWAGAARAMKGGIGSASIALPNGLVVGAIAAVNAVGDVIDPVDRQGGGGRAHRRRQGAGRRARAAFAPARSDARRGATRRRQHDDRRRRHQRDGCRRPTSTASR